MSNESLEEYLKKNCVKYKGIMWQYTNDPNDINDAIYKQDENWEGLKSPDQILSITYDVNHGCYVVFWINDCYRMIE